MSPPPNLDILLVSIAYPGMTHVESEITRAWLRARGAEYDEIAFNVRLGRGLDPGEGFSDATRRDAELLTQKRADIVARQGDLVEILEVKVRASFAALGQLAGYRALWLREHAETRDVLCKIIARSADPDIEYVARAQACALELFPRVELSPPISSR